jgi:DNA mismatch repair protein MutL
MPKIFLLPQEVSSKIAAGEVVERPASVVKELIENAFDAGANFVKIYLKEGGKREIAVYDNGEGMEPEDLRLCYRHHATSKIRSLADLFKVVTYGFRGEALASISQVSVLTIKSKTEAQDTGFQLRVEFGEEKELKPVAFSKGTLVKVERLFENLPARKAFLKSARAETLRTSEILKGLLLCRPDIACEFYSDGKRLFEWKGGEVKELLAKITGLKKEAFEREGSFSLPPCKLHFVLTSTENTFKHTKYLYFVVNKRWVKDERLSRIFLSVLKEHFGSLGFPAGVFYLELPPHLIDVNVHPAKWEIRLKDEKTVFELAKRGLLKAFARPYFAVTRPPTTVVRDEPAKKESYKEDIPVSSYFPRKVFSLPEFKVLGSLFDTYILIEKGEELYIIDQHALSERILFERLKEGDWGGSQKLIFPEKLRLSEEARERFKEKRPALERLGFEFDERDDGIYLKGVPRALGESYKEVLEEILETQFVEEKKIKEELLASLACKMARKKGDVLAIKEMEYLVREMFEKGLKTCPHGRPLYFKLSKYEIEKKIKRIV